MHTNYRARRARWLAAAALGALFPASAWADQAEAGGGIETVVVTAQKRAEDIRNVPIAITAVSGDTLRDHDIVNFHDLANIAPNFVSNQLGDSRASAMVLRGVTSQQGNAGE